MKVLTKRPTNQVLIEFLVGLRLRLLQRLGGANVIDFYVLCMSDEEGGFVIIFCCLPQLEKLGDLGADLAWWKNPLTGETSESFGGKPLEEARVDFGKGVGQFLCFKPALKAQVVENGELMMRRLYAFNRVPGSREIFDEFINESAIFAELR